MNNNFYIIIFFLLFGCIDNEISNKPCGEIPSETCLEEVPYFCLNGEIIENAEICGCPKNMELLNNKCEYKKCSDGTIYGNCSEIETSYFCNNGILEYNPKLCGCPSGMELLNDKCEYKNCDDGTLHNNCSEVEISYFCNNGVLEYNPKLCGCPSGMELLNDKCEYKKCEDGTIYDNCSEVEISYFCNNGTLEHNPKLCGCPKNTFLTTNEKMIYNYYCDDKYPYKCGEQCWFCYDEFPVFCCISEKINWCCDEGYMCDYENRDCKEEYIIDVCREYESSPKSIKFNYFYNGKNEINLILYEGVNEYLFLQEREDKTNTEKSFYENYENELQKKYINKLIDEIKKKTSNEDEQAKIAISLVQRIPSKNIYWYGKNYNVEKGNKYAYEVLFTNEGDGSEKTELLAYILKELGYGVVIFDFENSNFKALGVKCDEYETYRNTGYCFVRADMPQIITSMRSMILKREEVERDRILRYNFLIPNDEPRMYKISDGKNLKLTEERKDAVRMEKLAKISEGHDYVLGIDWFYEFKDLFSKYDLYE